jgi:hypothetical protein
MSAERAPSGAARWVGVLLAGVVGVVLTEVALARVLTTEGGDLASTLRAALVNVPIATGVLAAVPMLVAIAAGVIAIRPPAVTAGAAARVAAAATAGPAGDPNAPALALLGLLQQEGRFLDFVEEDIAGYSDESVGSAARTIHDGCRSALRERLRVEPILPGEDGSTVTVEKGFDPGAIRLTGNVRGEPPYRGVLRHPGWRSRQLTLPERTGAHDASVLAPAEVEVS